MEFNRTSSFSEDVIRRVAHLLFGHGATPDEIAEKIEELTLSDATWIMNILLESANRRGETYKPI